MWLCKDKKKHKRYIHRLVLEAFIGPCPMGQQTRHLNGIRGDNRLENLRWGTYKENNHDKAAHGTNGLGKLRPQTTGDKHPMAKLKEADVRAIYAAVSGGATKESMAQQYGVTWGCIHLICNRRNWKHLDL